MAIRVVSILAAMMAFYACGQSSSAPEQGEKEDVEKAVKEKKPTVYTTPNVDASESDQPEPEKDPEPKPEAKPPKPEPTLEELARSQVNRAFGVPKQTLLGFRAGEQNGCYRVLVRFYENTKDAVEADMHNIYQNVYGNERLRNTVCALTTVAFGDVRAPGEKSHREKIYTTTMSGEKARALNWQRAYDIEFSKEWRVVYLNPALQRQEEADRARDRAERRRDCRTDEGLFDFDPLCP